MNQPKELAMEESSNSGPSNAVSKRTLEHTNSQEDIPRILDKKLKGGDKVMDGSDEQFTVVKSADRHQFMDVAKSLWATNKSNVLFSPAQAEAAIKYGASAIAYAYSHMGTNFSSLMKNFENNIKAEIEKLATKLPEQQSTSARSSYADMCRRVTSESGSSSVADRSVPASMMKKTEKSCFAVIQAAEQEDEDPNQAELWTEVISKRQSKEKFKVLETKKTKNKNLAIHFADPQERGRFEEALKKNPIPGAKLRSSADKKIIFAIRRVPGHYDATRLTADILAQNDNHPFIVKNKPVIRDSRILREGEVDERKEKTFQLVTNAKDALLLLDTYFFIGLTRVKVSLWKPNQRCSNCHGTKHVAAECKADTVCKHCAGKHVSYRCPDIRNKEKYKCIICHRLGNAHSHRADSEHCEVLKKEVNEELQHTRAMILANHG